MRLDALTLEQCEIVRLWRNQCLEALRTPYPLTKGQQEKFYRERVCDPNSPHRYWAIMEKKGHSQDYSAPHGISEIPTSHGTYIEDRFIGMGGLTYIQWENRIAEISLILDPQYRGKGLGEKAVDLLLAEGFDRLGLKTVFGEVYNCNPEGVKFWQRAVEQYASVPNSTETAAVWLPNRKFWGGKFRASMYFSIDADDWRKAKHGESA